MRIEFNTYQIFFYAKPFQHRFIQLFMDDETVGSITFDDFDTVPDNTSTDESINLKMHEKDYGDVIDLLRNEAPLYIWINPDNGVGGLATGDDEPIGENESSFIG